MALQVWTFGDEAVAADFNALVNDLPRSFIYAMRVPMLASSTASTSYPGTPDFSVDIDVFLGDYLAMIGEFYVTGGGTYTLKIDIDILGTVDSLTMSGTSAAYTVITAPFGITALTNNGDVRGLSGTLKFYMKTTAGTFYMRNLRICSGDTSDTTKYLE